MPVVWEEWGALLPDLTAVIIIIKVFIECNILSVDTVLSAYTHVRTQTHTRTHVRTRTHTHTHTPTHTNTDRGTRAHEHSERDEYNSTERITWHVYSFGKRNVLMLHFIESREGFCRRGCGRSFRVEGTKTESIGTVSKATLVQFLKDRHIGSTEREDVILN